MAERAIKELGGERDLRIEVRARRRRRGPAITPWKADVALPTYKLGDKVATRKAYGDTLAALGARPEVVALDGEVSNSTHADEFKKAFPDRFFEMYIAEQQMVAAAVGLQVRGYIAVRLHLRRLLLPRLRLHPDGRRSPRRTSVSAGSHAGVEIGADGPSQMALEDLAALRAVHGSTILYPCDASAPPSWWRQMADRDGHLATSAPLGAPTRCSTTTTSEFPIGGARVVRRSDDRSGRDRRRRGHAAQCARPQRTRWPRRGITCRVIDCYSVKPIAVDVLAEAARDCGGILVVVEDHSPEGGLGAAVMEALAGHEHPPRISHLAVRELPGSGKPAELMAAAGIDAEAIARAARAAAKTAGGH